MPPSLVDSWAFRLLVRLAGACALQALHRHERQDQLRGPSDLVSFARNHFNSGVSYPIPHLGQNANFLPQYRFQYASAYGLVNTLT